MKRNVHGIGLALLGLGIGFGATVYAQTPARRPSRIGVVDIGVLFKDYKRKDDLEAKINQEREDMKSHGRQGSAASADERGQPLQGPFQGCARCRRPGRTGRR